MKELVIVANTPSRNTQTLVDAVVRGANHPDVTDVNINCYKPPEANAETVLKAHAIILGTTENFGAMSGLMKDFFERIYYPCLEEKQGLPYALYIKAGLDGTGTKIGVEKILAGLRWRAVQDILLLKGDYVAEFDTQCEELGTYVAAGLDAGVF